MFTMMTFQKSKIISEHARAARAIRIELAERFPGIAFSIKSKTFARGNNVTVDWTGGPTRSAIEVIVLKYRCGIFDALQNMYIYDTYRNNIPKAQYVIVSHHYTDAALKKAKTEISIEYDVDMDDNRAVFAALGNWPEALVRAKLEHRHPFDHDENTAVFNSKSDTKLPL
jgi:hypothetical protein